MPKKNLISVLLIIPVLLTPFIYSNELYNGVISAKQFWFYGAMALLMAGTGLQLLFSCKSYSFSINAIGISLWPFFLLQYPRRHNTMYAIAAKPEVY